MNKFTEVVNWMLDWRYSPFCVQRWLFGTGTRSVEVISLATLAALVALFTTEPEAVNSLPVYREFQMIPPRVWVAVMTATWVGMVGTMLSRRYIAQMLRGWLLIACGLIFMLVGVAYTLAYPPFTPGMVIFPTLAILCTLAGNNKMQLLKDGDVK